MEYLFIISIGLLVFFFFSLITRRKKGLPEWIFMSWLVLLVVTEFSFVLYARGNAARYPLFIATVCDTHLLHPFFLYMYIKSGTIPDFKIKAKELLHLIPFVFHFFAKIYANKVAGVMECYDEGSCLNVDNDYVTGFYIFKYLVMLIYIYLSYQLVEKHKRSAGSSRDAIINIWLSNLVKGTFFLFIGIMLIQVFRLAFPVLLYDRMLITSTLATFFIYILLFMANNYSTLFVAERVRESRKIVAENDNYKNPEREKLNNKEKALMQKAEKYISNNKSYLNGMLTLKDMADELGCPQRHLSHCINVAKGQSFTNYINTFRVEHLKGLLDDPKNKNYTILSLAEDSGFNSKTTLVRIFKQHTGMTPSEYQQQVASAQ